MKKLIVSLILTVFAATLGLGWLFDYVYSTFGSSRQSHLQHLEEMAGSLSLSLDNLEAANASSSWKSGMGTARYIFR